jgi:hypothetical protein
MVPQATGCRVPKGIRTSQEAFVRDLPELLRDQNLRGKWVAYHGDERIGIDADDAPLIRECLRRGLTVDQYIVDVIEPKPPEPESVSFPSSWR